MTQSRRNWITGAAVGLVAPAWVGCKRRSAAVEGEEAAPTSGAAPADTAVAAPVEAGAAAMTPFSLKRLEVKGTARLRGQAHGAAHRELITECVSDFMEKTAALRASGEAAKRWAQVVKDVRSKLGAESPEALEELEGIAAEVGGDPAAHLAYALEEDILPALDIQLLRARIAEWLGSDVIALPNVTGRVTRVLFRMVRPGPLTLVDHVGEELDMPALVLGRPGTLGCFGINRDGLACAKQPLLGGRFFPEGQLCNATFRKVLKAPNHQSASAGVNDWKFRFETSFFVADSQKAISVEAFPTSTRILGTFAMSATAAHTNHRVGPVPADDALAQASLARLKTMRALFPSGEDPELKAVIKKMQTTTTVKPGQRPRLLFAANLKPEGTQISWRAENAVE